MRFFVRDLEPLLDQARATLASFLGAPPNDLVFVPNATTGVNTVLRSLVWQPHDELLVTNQEYNACRNALNAAAQRAGARVVAAKIPFPLQSSDQIVSAVLEKTGPKTRLALLDHVTSQTGLVFPIERLIRELNALKIDTLVDGAHAPGMAPVDLARLSPAYYTGNCHKWLCAPKGAAFLYVRPDRQASIHPLTISHGANSPRTDRSRFLLEFGWTGTSDPTAWLSVPEAIKWMSSIWPGGWPSIRERNHRLAVAARKVLCEALGIPPPCPEEMLGALASLPLPPGGSAGGSSPLYGDPLQEDLWHHHGIEVPIIPWPEPPQRLLRISAQLYNRLEQYQALAQALIQRL